MLNAPYIRLRTILIPNQNVWSKIMNLYPRDHLLIVSNSAGTNDDPENSQAKILERNTGISVLSHATKKPGCYPEIQQYFADKGILPHEILIVGDRLFTDMLMANMMGSWGLWLSDGVEQSQKVLPKLERGLYQTLVTDRPHDPYTPNTPKTA